MLNALTYITRACPRACEYCRLRDATDVGVELTPAEWYEAFKILKELGIEFNLILGNETWLIGDPLPEIVNSVKIPYALYTTCPEPTFSKYKNKFFNIGGIDNLSCGIDYPLSYLEKLERFTDDSERKSLDAWKGFKWLKKHFPQSDSQGTITVHRKNIQLVPQIVKELSDLGVFVGINFIHWNKDGLFDFFPQKKEIEDLIFDGENPDHVNMLKQLSEEITKQPMLVQNPEMLKNLDPELPIKTNWHCKGDPYGGPTIDADGSLRLCGYRRGERLHKSGLTIFDLATDEGKHQWEHLRVLDAKDCPGCFWSYPWMFHYWAKHNSDMGKDVFTKHAGEHIPKEKWAERRLEGGTK